MAHTHVYSAQPSGVVGGKQNVGKLFSLSAVGYKRSEKYAEISSRKNSNDNQNDFKELREGQRERREDRYKPSIFITSLHFLISRMYTFRSKGFFQMGI